MSFDVAEISKDLPPIILWAAPVMISLVFVEYWVKFKKFRKKDDSKDMVAATIIGLGHLVSNAITKTLVLGLIFLIYKITPFEIPPTWWSYILCIFALDFCRYWAHRIGHQSRIFWATHVVHHNSKQYNWSVSFRLSWAQQIKVIFFLPVAFAGFHPIVFFICHQIEVLYQFWIHTELIHKLPKPIEYFFTTPSHHRVHHASNKKYLDKNYGSTFIIWDRMFGTFQAEEETPNYGILKEINTYNPVTLVFHEFVDIWKDLVKSPKKFMKILFKHPNQTLSDAEMKKWVK